MWFMCFDVVCFYSKDPQGSEVDMVEESDYTGIISFPDFKIPSNPKYFKLFVQKFCLKSRPGTFSSEADHQSNGAT